MPANISVSALGNALTNLLLSDDLAPGDPVSYQLAKEIYLYHPLGAKMVEAPIEMAQSQPREISVGNGPEDRVKQAFIEEWEALDIDTVIYNVVTLSRVYGVAAVAVITDEDDTATALDLTKLYKQAIAFNVLDPLNISGSAVTNQNPNSADFLKIRGVSVFGQQYHRTRIITKINENPIYLGYTSSAFGYTGRSVYQRALFPLKSFVKTMISDEMIATKLGVLIAKIKQPGSIIDNIKSAVFGFKRNVLKEASTNNVISIAPEETIETLNMQNVDGAGNFSRNNILKNIATATPMPAKLLENEALVEGFSEGAEDAKLIAQYIDRFRIDLRKTYAFFDKIVMYRAWNPEFYDALRADYPEYRNVSWQTAFFEWKNSFKAVWPSLLREPDSDKIKVDDIRMKAIISLIQVLIPILDPENKAALIEWVQDNINLFDLMFETHLSLDIEALINYEPPAPGGIKGDGEEEKLPKPPDTLSASDSASVRKIVQFINRGVVA